MLASITLDQNSADCVMEMPTINVKSNEQIKKALYFESDVRQCALYHHAM
jgi:hypothetical protein